MTSNKTHEPIKLFPIVAVGAVVVDKGKILLVKRANEPSKGLWAIPGGKVEPGETLQAAAEREIAEETGLTIKASMPVYTFDLIQRQGDTIKFHYVIIDMLARLVEGELSPAGDALDARWFSPDEIDADSVNKITRDFLMANLSIFEQDAPKHK
jgi:8-oxo-dGTP diphosphatase